MISILIVMIYSVKTYTEYKRRQEKLNVEWGMYDSNLENVEDERVSFKGQPKENYVNGF